MDLNGNGKWIISIIITGVVAVLFTALITSWASLSAAGVERAREAREIAVETRERVSVLETIVTERLKAIDDKLEVIKERCED